MGRYSWQGLNNQQIGRYAEYFVKMEFTMHGFEVYSSEVDDRGIDFVVRSQSGHFYEIQVKSTRNAYVFSSKDKMALTPQRLLALVLFDEAKEPSLFLIPSMDWNTPDTLLKDHRYEGKKSKPEWGVNISGRTRPLLERYKFSDTVAKLEGRK